MAALEAEAERTERAIGRRAAAPTRSGAPRPPLSGKRCSRWPSSRKTGLPLSMASPIGVRCESGKRRQPADLLVLNPNVATISTAVPSSAGKRDHAGVAREQLATLAERDVVDGIGGDGAARARR